MKFGKVGQVVLVSTIALVVASLFTACGTLNVGFMFVATKAQTPGQIEVYEVDSESGSVRTIPTSPFPSGGRNPISEAVSPDSLNFYVANQDDANVVQFGIGTDGKLYPSSTVNTPGSFPMAIAINSTNTFLYGVDTLGQIAGCSLTNTCPGNVFVCPVNKGGSLGTPVNNTNQCLNSYALQLTPTDTKDVLTPTALNVTANGQYVYVSAYRPATNTTPIQGYLFGYTANTDGTLSAMNGGLPYSLAAQTAGSDVATPIESPTALLSDTSSGYLMVADSLTNRIASYPIGAGGALSATTAATTATTIATGNQPSAMTLFQDKFLYVTNSLDSTVSAYTFSAGNLANIGTYASDNNPIAVTTDPRELGFLYTVNFLGNSLSGFQIDQNAGTLINTQNTPYVSSAQPTTISGIPHGGKTTAAAAQ